MLDQPDGTNPAVLASALKCLAELVMGLPHPSRKKWTFYFYFLLNLEYYFPSNKGKQTLPTPVIIFEFLYYFGWFYWFYGFSSHNSSSVVKWGKLGYQDVLWFESFSVCLTPQFCLSKLTLLSIISVMPPKNIFPPKYEWGESKRDKSCCLWTHV